MTDKTTTEPEALFEEVIKARQQGYAMISDELEYGITSLAVPVTVPGYGVVGAVNSSATTNRVNMSTFVQERRDAVEETANKISQRLKTAPALLAAIKSMT